MRIRTIKPEFHQDEELAKLPRELRLLAAALISCADDHGWFRSHPALIAGAVFPFDADGQAFVETGLSRLAAIGYVELHEGGVALLPSFTRHQVINKPSRSKLAEKAGAVIPVALPEDSRSPTVALPEGSHTEVEVEQGSGREVEAEVDAPKLPARVQQPPKVERVWVVKPPTTPPEQWTGEDFWRWAQSRRQAGGYAPEKWPHPRELGAWWSEVRSHVEAEALKAAFEKFGNDPHWERATPPFPWAAFVNPNQLPKYLPQGAIRATSV